MDERYRAITAMRWVTGGRLLERCVSWASTLFVIRLLAPQDYGLVAIAGIAIPVLSAVSDMGLGAAIVQGLKTSRDIVQKLYGAVILLNLLLFFVVQLIAGPVALFYGLPEAEPMTRVLAFVFLISSAASAPAALLVRDVHFKALSVIGTVQVIGTAIVTLILALRGFGAWALIAGQLLSPIVRTLCILVVTKLKLKPRFALTGIGQELRFGSLMTIKSLVHALNGSVVSAVVGRWLGSASVGQFSVASTLSRMPVRPLMRSAQQVMFPVVSRAQSDPARVASIYLRVVSGTLLLLLPACWGLALLAPDIVPLLLGEQWSTTAPLISIISFVLPLTVLSRPLNTALDGIGKPLTSLTNNLTLLVCTVCCVTLAVRWGILAVAVGWCVATFLGTWINLHRSLPQLSVPASTLISSINRTFYAAVFMVSMLGLAANTLPLDLGALTKVGTMLVIGLCTYALATAILNRKIASVVLNDLFAGRS